MNVWLLDVSVLVARFWETHIFHRRVRCWMNEHAGEPWATYAITQAGMVRTISNPVFSEYAPTPIEAIHWLSKSLANDPQHQFWPENLPHTEACLQTPIRLVGHKQLTDAYLLGLAMHHQARLLPLDQRMIALTAPQTAARDALSVLE